MMAMFNAGAAPAGGPLGWALMDAARAGQDWRTLHPLLCAQRDAGLPQADLVALLTELLGTHPEHDDWLRDALDMATGWCHPSWHVYPQRCAALAGNGTTHDAAKGAANVPASRVVVREAAAPHGGEGAE